MPKYVLAYHGAPKFDGPEAGQAHMQAWKAWMEGLGAAVIDPGLPVGPSKTIQSDGRIEDHGGANPISGITVIEADDMEAALALAAPCPHVSAGGSIEVAEALDMQM